MDNNNNNNNNNNKHIYNVPVAIITDPEARSMLHNVTVLVNH